MEDSEGCGTGWVFFDKMITVSEVEGECGDEADAVIDRQRRR